MKDNVWCLVIHQSLAEILHQKVPFNLTSSSYGNLRLGLIVSVIMVILFTLLLLLGIWLTPKHTKIVQNATGKNYVGS